MAIDDHKKVATAAAMPESRDVQELKKQISQLTEQVAALTTQAMQRPKGAQQRSVPCCFSCNRVGHMQRDCPNRHRCFACGQTGHLVRFCQQQGNFNGTPVSGRGRPYPQ